MEKDLNYWRSSAEEDYIGTPISVLKYICELENAVARSGVPTLCKDFDNFIDEQYLSTDKQFENDLL